MDNSVFTKNGKVDLTDWNVKFLVGLGSLKSSYHTLVKINKNLTELKYFIENILDIGFDDH
jgi:hypothetical protein